jgi:hypothetical protein
MSFYTSLRLKRPTKPPVITGDSLARFVAAFEQLNISEGEGPLKAQVKFGETIDQDDRPAGWYESVNEIVSVAERSTGISRSIVPLYRPCPAPWYGTTRLCTEP